MKPSAIIKLVVVFFIIFVTGTIFLFVLSKDKAKSTTHSEIPHKINAMILQDSKDDTITKEYHLSLKVSLLTKEDEIILNPKGKLTIKLFSPQTIIDVKKEEMVMLKEIEKEIDLSKANMTNGELQINLKSGFKVLDKTDYLLLEALYEDVSGKLIRCNPPLYKY